MSIKSLIPALSFFGLILIGSSGAIDAQDNGEEMGEETTERSDTTEADTARAGEESAMAADTAESEGVGSMGADGKGKEEKKEVTGMHQQIKQKFIEGNPYFMSFVLICLIIGLALCIERIVYLNLATTNTDKLLNDVEGALESEGVEGAKEVCRNTKGPIASIFYQGLDRSDEGTEVVEKSVVSYGGVQMGLLEKGLSWIQLFIAIAPMLGFMGTVFGMISAFDSIAQANNISPKIVADGIQQALITTVSGLIVGIVLQFFYNYIVAKVDSLVNQMEDASISLVDLLVKYNITKGKGQ